MPFTPFHLGPALLLGALLYRRLDLPTLLAGSVVVDVRAALVVFGPLDGPVHGILTTFVGGTAVALPLAAATLRLPGPLRTLADYARPADTDARGPVVAGALVGVSSHVLLDSLLYADARPLYPLEGNPFLTGDVLGVHLGCLLAGVLGAVAFAGRYAVARLRG